jgi:hypothetical protein
MDGGEKGELLEPSLPFEVEAAFPAEASLFPESLALLSIYLSS